MVSAEAVICNKLGLHARAASKFVNVSGRYSCDLKVSCNGKTIDGKSIMALMLLAASKGTTIVILADGEDEQEAVSSLLTLINNKFDEGE